MVFKPPEDTAKHCPPLDILGLPSSESAYVDSAVAVQFISTAPPSLLRRETQKQRRHRSQRLPGREVKYRGGIGIYNLYGT
jgi:hypothetical protein